MAFLDLCFQQLQCTNIPGLNSKVAFPGSSQEANTDVFASGTCGNISGILLTIQNRGSERTSCCFSYEDWQDSSSPSGSGSLKMFPISTNLKNFKKGSEGLSRSSSSAPASGAAGIPPHSGTGDDRASQDGLV